MSQLTWLHLSDIHFHPKLKWRDGHSQDQLLSYLAQCFKDEPHLRPDLVFCTGDIAFGALPKAPLSGQYAQAKQFFDELLRVCGKDGVALAKERLFVVPGNHDIDRGLINQSAQNDLYGKTADSAAHVDAINKRFAGRQLEFQDDIRRLAEYGKFVKSYLPHQHDEQRRICYALTVAVGDLQVGIAGLNSAWSCAGNEDDRKLWLAAEWQFNNAQTALKVAPLRIALMHHPIDNLNLTERDTVTRRLASDFHFFLHGHAHNAWVEPSTCITVAAGAVGAQSKDEFGINLVRLDLATGKGEVHLHRYDKTGWMIAPVPTHAPKAIWPFALPNVLLKNLEDVVPQVPAPEPALVPAPVTTLAHIPAPEPALGAVLVPPPAHAPAPVSAPAGADESAREAAHTPAQVREPAPPHVHALPTQGKLYGRDTLLKTTAAKLQQHPVLLVFGLRGNGKTWFIEALAAQGVLTGEAIRIQADPDMNADRLFRQFAWALGETADFPLAPTGEVDAIAKEFKRRYPNPRAGWLWLDRAHVLLGKDGFRLPEVRKLLLGLQKAYGKTWAIVLELRERPPKGLLGADALECEVPGLDKQAMAQALADAAPPGRHADWCLSGNPLTRVYNWLGGGSKAHPLALSLLIEVGRALDEAPITVLERKEVADKIETFLLGDLINKVLNPAERKLIQVLALYRVAIPDKHADWLEAALNLQGAWDGINKRCLLTAGNKGLVFYLHGFIADWLRVGLGYQSTDEAGQAEFATQTSKSQIKVAQDLHIAVATCWLKLLDGSTRKSQPNIERASEAFFHLTAGAQGDRVQEIALDLLSGNEAWAIARIAKLANFLFTSGAPIKEQRLVHEYWVALAPDNPFALRYLGECWAKEEGWASEKAAKCFEKACKNEPGFPKHWANLGKCLLAQGDEGARTFLLRLAVLGQDYPQAIDDHVIAVQLNCLIRLGEHAMASRLRMEKIQEGSLNAAFYSDEAKARLNAGDHHGALQILDLAQQRHCTNNVTDAIRSSALAASGQGDAADTLRLDKINAGSQHTAHYNDEAKARLAAGNATGALAILDLAAQRRCSNEYTDSIRADVLTRLGQPQAASALRMEKIHHGSRNPAFYNAEAQARLAANDAAGALELLDLAQKRGCADDYTATLRAKVLQRLNHPA
jgi:predicted phosphodiesterase